VLADRLDIDPVHLWVELGVLVEASPRPRRAGRSRPEAIHREIERALSTGDVEDVLALCAEDVLVHVPGRNPFAGEYRGKQGVMAIGGLLKELSGGQAELKTEPITATNHLAVHMHRVRMEVQGEVLDMHSLVVSYFRDDKIAEVWIYPEDQYQVDDFWASVGRAVPRPDGGT
jgi:ketosteroid isomerase-like protein